MESWKRIHRFVEEFPDDHLWGDWKVTTFGVLSALERRGLGSLFIVGQSMHILTFYALNGDFASDEPRVHVNIEREQARLCISTVNPWADMTPPWEEHSIADALPAVLVKFRQLWLETHRGEALPTGLAEP